MAHRIDQVIYEREQISKQNSRAKYYLGELQKEAEDLQRQIDARVELMKKVRSEISDRNDRNFKLGTELEELTGQKRRDLIK